MAHNAVGGGTNRSLSMTRFVPPPPLLMFGVAGCPVLRRWFRNPFVVCDMLDSAEAVLRPPSRVVADC